MQMTAIANGIDGTKKVSTASIIPMAAAILDGIRAFLKWGAARAGRTPSFAPAC